MAGEIDELWDANALWPGAVIRERLEAMVPDLRRVMTVDEFDPSLTHPRQLPAAIVMLDALRPDVRTNVYTRPLNCDQDWLVAVAVRSARPDADGAAAKAGVLLPRVVAALHGYVPPGATRGFVWRAGPNPSYGADVSYYPLMFALQGVMGA